MISLKLGSTVHLHFYPQTFTIIAGQTENTRRWPIPAFAQAPPLGIDWICKRKVHFGENLAFFCQITLKNLNAKWRLRLRGRERFFCNRPNNSSSRLWEQNSLFHQQGTLKKVSFSCFPGLILGKSKIELSSTSASNEGRDSSATLIGLFDTHYNLSNDNNKQTKAHFFAKVLYTYLENKRFSSQYELLPRCNASYSGTRYCFTHWSFDRPERSLRKQSLSRLTHDEVIELSLRSWRDGLGGEPYLL